MIAKVGQFLIAKNRAETPGADLVDILQNMRGAVPVQTTSSREEGFLGWMLEAAGHGTFVLAARIFGKAVQIVNSKADQEVEPAADPAR